MAPYSSVLLLDGDNRIHVAVGLRFLVFLINEGASWLSHAKCRWCFFHQREEHRRLFAEPGASVLGELRQNNVRDNVLENREIDRCK